MLLADLVAASDRTASTRSRSAKIAALSDVLRRLSPEEVEPAVAFLTGEPRQGKVGVGWAMLAPFVDLSPAAATTLTVGDLDDAIGRIASMSGPGSAGARRTALAELLGAATAPEADFVRRLLIGDLRQGALEGVMADAVAVAADVPAPIVRRACMLAGDLARVACLALEGGEPAVAAVGLEVLRPVQPMLASTAADVAEAVGAMAGPASVEWKLDGARVQAHRRGDEVRLYTRNLNDVTARLPGVVEVVRSLPVDAVVLDGEVLGVTDDDRPDVFQESMRRFSRQDGGGTRLGVFFFDCLHVDGDDLLDLPLIERVAVLDRVVDRRWRIPSVMTDDVAAAAGVLDDALAAGHEGVMVKSASSTYEAGRRGAAWRKVKPVRTLDLVVLAVEWGSGRRKGWLSNLHLGARGHDGGFVMVGKTFKGLTDELLTWQTEQLLARETAREGHVVHVRPELVVEIALDGVQVSPRYAGGVALRFARVRRYRTDKSAADVDTIDTVRSLLPGA